MSKTAWACMAIAGATLLAYVPLLIGEVQFLGWDDDVGILGLPIVQELSSANLVAAFGTNVLGAYGPIALIFRALLVECFGLTVAPLLWATLALHIANALLVFSLSLRLLSIASARDTALQGALRPVAAAGLTALLFALSPLRVEVVAWASGQPYALAGFFFLVSLHAYLRYAMLSGEARFATRAGWLLASVVGFALAGLSKSTAIFLPAVLFALDFYPLRRRLRSSLILEKIPHALVAVLLALEAIQASVVGAQPTVTLSPLARVTYALHGLVFHLAKSVYPADLSPNYALKLHDVSPFADGFLWSTVASIFISVAALGVWRRRPALASAFACYVAGFLPVSGLITHNRESLGADRYTYMPLLGLCLVLAATLTSRRLLPGGPLADGRSRLLSGAVIVVLGCFALSTWDHIADFRDTESLWRYALRSDPANPYALNNLGSYLLDRNRYDEAVEVLRVGVYMAPENPRALLNLGYGLEQLGRFEDTLQVYQRGLAHHSSLPALHNNLAATYLRLGRTREARAELARAAELGLGR